MCRPVLTFYLLLSTDTAAETAQLRWRCRDKANCFFFSFPVGECVQLNRRGRLADADTRVDAVAGVFWRKFGFEHRETDRAPLDMIPLRQNTFTSEMSTNPRSVCVTRSVSLTVTPKLSFQIISINVVHVVKFIF